jgi:hypothetical protein
VKKMRCEWRRGCRGGVETFFQRDEWIELFLSRDVCEKYVASRMNIKEVIDIPPITFIKEPIDVAI